MDVGLRFLIVRCMSFVLIGVLMASSLDAGKQSYVSPLVNQLSALVLQAQQDPAISQQSWAGQLLPQLLEIQRLIEQKADAKTVRAWVISAAQDIQTLQQQYSDPYLDKALDWVMTYKQQSTASRLKKNVLIAAIALAAVGGVAILVAHRRRNAFKTQRPSAGGGPLQPAVFEEGRVGDVRRTGETLAARARVEGDVVAQVLPRDAVGVAVQPVAVPADVDVGGLAAGGVLSGGDTQLGDVATGPLPMEPMIGVPSDMVIEMEAAQFFVPVEHFDLRIEWDAARKYPFDVNDICCAVSGWRIDTLWDGGEHDQHILDIQKPYIQQEAQSIAFKLDDFFASQGVLVKKVVKFYWQAGGVVSRLYAQAAGRDVPVELPDDSYYWVETESGVYLYRYDRSSQRLIQYTGNVASPLMHGRKVTQRYIAQQVDLFAHRWEKRSDSSCDLDLLQKMIQVLHEHMQQIQIRKLLDNDEQYYLKIFSGRCRSPRVILEQCVSSMMRLLEVVTNKLRASVPVFLPVFLYNELLSLCNKIQLMLLFSEQAHDAFGSSSHLEAILDGKFGLEAVQSFNQTWDIVNRVFTHYHNRNNISCSAYELKKRISSYLDEVSGMERITSESVVEALPLSESDREAGRGAARAALLDKNDSWKVVGWAVDKKIVGGEVKFFYEQTRDMRVKSFLSLFRPERVCAFAGDGWGPAVLPVAGAASGVVGGSELVSPQVSQPWFSEFDTKTHGLMNGAELPPILKVNDNYIEIENTQVFRNLNVPFNPDVMIGDESRRTQVYVEDGLRAFLAKRKEVIADKSFIFSSKKTIVCCGVISHDNVPARNIFVLGDSEGKFYLATYEGDPLKILVFHINPYVVSHAAVFSVALWSTDPIYIHSLGI